MDLYSRHPVWDTSAVGLGVHEGRDAVRTFHEDWQRGYEDFEMVVTDLKDLGNGVTVTVFDQRGRPKGGTGFVELPFALVTTWTEGLADQATAYADVDASPRCW
jgi:ketosteroid isomerase-like protein